MKATELIKQLEAIVEINGDLPLLIIDDMDDTLDVGNVKVGKYGACDVIEIIVG